MATPLMTWLAEKVETIGWTEFLRRGEGVFTQGALQGWLRGAKPGPAYQAAIAKAAGVSPTYVRDLVWKSWEMQEATGALAIARRKRARQSRRGARTVALLAGLLNGLVLGPVAEAHPYPLSSDAICSLLSDIRRKWFGSWQTCPA